MIYVRLESFGHYLSNSRLFHFSSVSIPDGSVILIAPQLTPGANSQNRENTDWLLIGKLI